MKKKDQARRFESDVLGVPPLKLTLVNTDEIRRDGQKKTRTLRNLGRNAKYRSVVEKLIKHLKELDK
jgi:hypothetical protein